MRRIMIKKISERFQKKVRREESSLMMTVW
jgi:hypothetical protein